MYYFIFSLCEESGLLSVLTILDNINSRDIKYKYRTVVWELPEYSLSIQKYMFINRCISAARLWMHWDIIMWIPFTVKEALIRTNWTVSKQKETICGKNRKKKQIPILNIFLALLSILACVRSDLWFSKKCEIWWHDSYFEKAGGFFFVIHKWNRSSHETEIGRKHLGMTIWIS